LNEFALPEHGIPQQFDINMSEMPIHERVTLDPRCSRIHGSWHICRLHWGSPSFFNPAADAWNKVGGIRLWGCFLIFMLVQPVAGVWAGAEWTCEDAAVSFTHKPSDYYGSGEYFAVCPENGSPIRCYHYHRHWICEKGKIYYWDRNLESAARTACGCPLPTGVAPSSPAISTNPAHRIIDFPAKTD
jgi:hypothetical protein